ncbi:uncharacterized protein LOC135468860 [Liolophura sinensis]|uniref:uncharacterized protein LOC135468860 n=1 Tax=Liolophura sinensis TaxID=3198878 RepID=UPI0031590E81
MSVRMRRRSDRTKLLYTVTKMACQRSIACSVLLFSGAAFVLFQQGAAIFNPKPCPKDAPEMTCDNVDPCGTTECKAYPLAKCSVYNCGGCFAQYYINEQRVNCDVCLHGGAPTQCAQNPCASQNPGSGQLCVPDYCCGCSTRIVDLCDDGTAPQGCLFDPCVNLICPEGSQCVSSACGECTAQCIDGNGDVVPVGQGEQGKGRGPPAPGRGRGERKRGQYSGGK